MSYKMALQIIINLDFKLSPCSEWRILSSGRFPGAWILSVSISEHPVNSIFIGGVSRRNCSHLYRPWRWNRVFRNVKTKFRRRGITQRKNTIINPLNVELNPICHLLVLLGPRHIFHVSVSRVNLSYPSLSHCSKYSYNRSQQDAFLITLILVKSSTCFGQTYCPSSGVMILYLQQLVFVILLTLTVCCEYSIKTPDDGQTKMCRVLVFKLSPCSKCNLFLFG